MSSNPINLTIRAAGDDDYPFLWDLNEVAMRDLIAALSCWDHDAQEELFRARFIASQWRILVGADGVDMGAYALKQSKEMSILTDIYLLPQYQGRGIGSFIVSGLISEAAKTKRPLTLLVLKDNLDAKRLYERLGMRVIGEMGDQLVMKS